jgi:hypothetical protein
MKFPLLIASFVLVLTGCASTIFQARTDRTGDFFLRDSLKANPNTPRLYIETAPDDFELNRGKVSYDKIRYEYIGRIYVKRDFEHWRLGFVDFNEAWRRYYCPPVVTLTYATALVPMFLTPLPYFCVYENSASADRIEQRKRYMAFELLKEGKRVGATHIVFASYTGLEYPDGGGNPGTVDNERALQANGGGAVEVYTGMIAHAFRRKSAKE